MDSQVFVNHSSDEFLNKDSSQNQRNQNFFLNNNSTDNELPETVMQPTNDTTTFSQLFTVQQTNSPQACDATSKITALEEQNVIQNIDTSASFSNNGQLTSFYSSNLSDDDINTSIENETLNNSSTSSSCHVHNQNKRQQFSAKQRMDLYAFCVLELEMFSNKVSIKKQQQAIEKVLNEERKLRTQITRYDNNEPQQSAVEINIINNSNNNNNSKSNSINNSEQLGNKSLSELKLEIESRYKCYSDHQKTQVLTSSMLRDVQRRFARYYIDSPIPSRTTIKHVFEKCVAYGSVENIKTPRKPSKATHRDELEHLLVTQPKLSLRQIAQKLNVSTGTVSRRCKALGLMPESVTKRKLQKITKNYKHD